MHILTLTQDLSNCEMRPTRLNKRKKERGRDEREIEIKFQEEKKYILIFLYIYNITYNILFLT